MNSSTSSRLSQSSSPYLRQHANNPVDWYPWGEEALNRAKQENKPIFLSIGYSTCHWCHVMAHESFENPEIAKIMNEHFVSVKVDREERPDLDRQYMLYVQATTGSGGWPLNVFLSPKLIPFLGGTYFPPEDASSSGRLGFRTLLTLIAERWKSPSDRSDLEQSGGKVINQLKKIADFVPSGTDYGGEVTRIKSISKAFLSLKGSFDVQNGGFGTGTKFPMPSALEMLLNYWVLWRSLSSEWNKPTITDLRKNFDASPGTGEPALWSMWKETVRGGLEMAEEAKAMVVKSLKRMAQGGIYDHVGGGFHRYTIDRSWTLPHFEKMLYDQAQLIKLYSGAFAAFRDNLDLGASQLFSQVVKESISYVKSRLTCPETGAFFAAEDADSLNPETGNVEEGAAFTWSDEEINRLLGDRWPMEDLKVFKYHYTILPKGNLFNVSPHAQLKERNVLLVRNDPSVTAEKLNRPLNDVERILKQGREILSEHRTSRCSLPARDEKIIASWNGMMVEALAVAYRHFQNPEFLIMAERAAQFVINQMSHSIEDVGGGSNRGLWRSFFNGQSSKIEGFAEDYSAVISGFIELHQVTFKSEYLEIAEELQKTLDELFRDRAGLGYFDSSSLTALFRIKDDHDGVEPSANSRSALNCFKLHLLTGRKLYSERFKQIIRLFTKRLDRDPQAMTALVSAIIMDAAKPIQLTFTKNAHPDEEVMRVIRKNYLPNLVVCMKPASSSKIGHVCIGNVCKEPTDDPKTLLHQLGLKDD